MSIELLFRKKVTVMGLGLHGGAVGTVKWLVAQGANITVTDMKTEQQLTKSLDQLKEYSGIKFVLGQHDEHDFTNVDMIVRNPSVPRKSKFLALARKANIPIEMDSSLFFKYSPSRDIIGVTGSKGKTTTANAITHVLTHVLPDTAGVGVDGVSPLGKLESIHSDTTVVFELSSWRLEALAERNISPDTAVLTSIYKDHLNTYDSFAEYIDIKKTIFAHQDPKDTAILNADDKLIRGFESEVPSRLFWYSLRAQIPGDGLYVHRDIITLRQDGLTLQFFSLHDLPLRFAHERRNLLPAILLGYLRGVSIEEIKEAIKTIKPLPHRLEVVRRLNGVTYINDSAATMPDATVPALASFSKTPIVHITGGSDKQLEFNDLGNAWGKVNLRALIWLPGNATDRMKKVAGRVAPEVPMYDVVSMEEAVSKADEIAQSGDTVLLSPGATSFGLFLHEFDRGDKFRAAVEALEEKNTAANLEE